MLICTIIKYLVFWKGNSIMKRFLKVAAKSTKDFFSITFALYTLISYGMMLVNIAVVNAPAPQWWGVAMLFSHILLFSALTALSEVAVGLIKKLNAALSRIIKFIFSYIYTIH